MPMPSTSVSCEIATLNVFITALEDEIRNASNTASVAVLVLSLRRSDRIAALLMSDYAQQTQQEFLAQIQPLLRAKDKYVFVNEDECWFMLPQLASEALAILAVHRLLNALNTPFKIDTQTVFFNPTVGIACAPMHGLSAMAILRAADAAQKNARRDNHKFLLAESQQDRGNLPQDLLSALEDVLDSNRLEMRYQPKVDVRSKTVVSVEALVRWPADHALSVATTVLIDTAERCGLIELLTMRVFNQVLAQHMAWRDSGMNMLVWVNLSAHLLSHEQLPKILERALSIWNVPANCIGLEITESALIHDIEHTTNLLFELKALGFHLSIDDFGTGYSSLTYLRRFPIDELKIDRMFIHGMTESSADKQIVQSIIGLGHNFGLPVVAEGVEEAHTLAALESMGCDQIQGYFFAKPMLGEALIDWCRDFHGK
ncbi:putative bifunctional diguanylate cyclase/phosphodiesterase [Undibacterium sp. Ren11W]|uniref:putative bifunctional diguanylate cyclase/phosphodiesterase n=1 Tax=Undibacterium sp. Ren11W TaxID=3413045 RepID=UPI003BF3AFE4